MRSSKKSKKLRRPERHAYRRKMTNPKVPSSWLDQCREWMRAQGLTTRAAAQVVTESIQRRKPFDHTAVVKYLSGQRPSSELTLAFAKAMNVSPPPMIVGADAAAQEWCDVGVRLQREAPEVFARELAELKALAEALEKRRKPR